MDVATKVGLKLLRVHQAIYAGTGGLLGHRMLGVPCLLLRTTGRRTGRSRQVSLVYARDGADYLLVPSLGGADQSPAWLANLRARAHVGVQIGRRRFRAIATVVERSDPNHARLWRIADDNNQRRYSRYQAKTKRAIPVVRLTPAEVHELIDG